MAAGRRAGESSRCEDPAPTVGRLRGFHCDPHRAQRPPIGPSIRVPCHPTCLPPMEPLWFLQRRGTPRRYVLREPELPDLKHFTRKKGKTPITNKGLNPYGPFAAVPPLEYDGLKPILPFFEGRSDAACRVVIRLHAVPVDNRTPPTGTGWLAIRTQWSPYVGCK